MRVAPVIVCIHTCFKANNKNAFNKNKINSYQEAAIRRSSTRPRIELLFVIVWPHQQGTGFYVGFFFLRIKQMSDVNITYHLTYSAYQNQAVKITAMDLFLYRKTKSK